MGGSQRTILSESNSHLPNILANWGSHEHQRRSPDCAFFTLMQSLNPPRAKKGRPSKASRMSTQSDVTAENLSMIEVRIDEGNSALTTATHMTMNSAAPKANKKATKAKKGKGKAQIATRTMEPEEAVQMSSFVEPEDDDFAVKIDSPKVPKGKRGKKRTSEEMDAEEAHVNEPLESSPPPAKRRTTRNRSSTVKPPHMPGSSNIDGNDSDIHMTDAETMPPPSIPTSAKGGKGGRKRASSTFRKASNTSTASKASLRRAIPADAEIDAVLEVDLDRPLTDEEEEEGMNIDVVEKPKTRRLTRTRPGSRNISASIAPAKDKRTRKPSAAQEEVPEQTTLSDDQTQQDDVMTTTNETESDNIPAAEESKTRSSSDSPPMPKEPSSRKPSKSQYNREPSHQLSGRSNRASVLSVVPMPIEPATEKHESILVVEKTTRGRSNSVPSPVIPSPRAESDLPEHQPIENEIQQPHIEHIQDIETKIQTPEPTQPEQRAVVSFSTTSKQIVPSPTPSPQSSNAENAPPSSLPSQRRPPLTQLSPSKAQTIRIPLAASTPTTSPSKRKTASKLETTCAWMLADIEKTLMGSPGLNGNSSRLFDETNVVLTTPEKKMTVEEWILHNAKQAEERLRNECERLVGRFEGEGVRALKALEGIVCIE